MSAGVGAPLAVPLTGVEALEHLCRCIVEQQEWVRLLASVLLGLDCYGAVRLRVEPVIRPEHIRDLVTERACCYSLEIASWRWSDEMLYPRLS